MYCKLMAFAVATLMGFAACTPPRHSAEFADAAPMTIAARDRTNAMNCPKVLMFDGVHVPTQSDPASAAYWAHTVGVDGFFLNNIMGLWQNDVGTDPNGPTWKMAAKFQKIYAAAGAGENFIKVAIWKPHDWKDAAANATVAANFGHAAALAAHVGFRGIALDLEPYVPIWGGVAGGPELNQTVYNEGKAIGKAMHDAYPGMTLVLMQDALYWVDKPAYNGGYALSLPFMRGLLSAGFDKVVFASERTYKAPVTASVVQDVRDEYSSFDTNGALPVGHVMVAPGVWPLGSSNTDKGARYSPGEFASRLRAAFAASDGYVWIYGAGSAWQTDGPIGKGRVDPNFQQFLDVLHTERADCGKSPH